MSAPLRLLLVEDSATDAELLVMELERCGLRVDFERVETPDAMRSALTSRAWDIVVSDWSLPKFSALGALGVLRETDPDLPFIIVSGTIGEEMAVEAMRAGARDYVQKDKLGRLAPAVERELREHRERAARRKAETALRESEGRFRRLAESGIIGILVADVNGNVLEANDAYLKLVGYSREELLNGALRWRDLTPPEFVPVMERAVAQLEASGVVPPFELETFRKDGTRAAIVVGVAMLEYPKTIAITADISERKHAEKARSHAEHALRESEEQLRQAQKMEAVGRLAGGIAHDFNNVLSVILSYAEVLLEDLKATDPIRRDIEQVHRAAQRAAAFTRQLLLFSRQQVSEPRVVDLADVLTGLDMMIGRILGEDVDFALLPPKVRGRVHVDPTHVEQVILNLVVNARDAMPTGGKLTLELANVELDAEYALGHLPAKPGPYVMLAVTDTGTGMDRATQARIFEPFFTTKEQGKGTGLGLSTVFGIVQQSGGTIWVYSELGKGTTFKIYLPRVEAEVDAPKPSIEPATLRGTETILLVEDEEQVRGILLNVLRRQGYKVISAQNAGEALLICEQYPDPIDLLVTDVVMPQMSGPDLARRLAQPRPEMKVLCMSGYTDDSIVRHGVLDARVAFVQKPVTPALLGRRIRELLDDQPAPSRRFSASPE